MDLMHPQQQVIEKSEYYVGWHIRKRMGCHAFLLYELNIHTFTVYKLVQEKVSIQLGSSQHLKVEGLDVG